MIQNILSFASHTIETWGSWGVFLISILEEVIAPIPSSLTIMAASFFLLPSYTSLGDVLLPSLLLVAIPASLGMTIGGCFVYAITYFGGKPIIDRWGKWIEVSWESVERINKHFGGRHSDEVALMGLRAIPIFPNSVISGCCGLIRYPFRSFLIFSFLGGIPRAWIMALIGWWAGEAYAEYAAVIAQFEDYILLALAVIIAIAVAYLVIRKRRKKYANSTGGL